MERYDLGAHDRRRRAAPLPRGLGAGLRRPRRVRRRPEHTSTSRWPTSSTTPSRPSGPAGSARPPRATKPVAAGNPAAYDGSCATAAAGAARDDADTENISTTNLTVADRWGNVVEYTLTIEQTGGSGIVVPGRGFILNNELTDFSAVYSATRPQPDPARQAPALVDVADDRAQGRRALAGARLARRLDDHHHGAADAVQPHRPRDDARAGHRGAARRAAQHGLGHGGAVVHRRVRRGCSAPSATSSLRPDPVPPPMRHRHRVRPTA